MRDRTSKTDQDLTRALFDEFPVTDKILAAFEEGDIDSGEVAQFYLSFVQEFNRAVENFRKIESPMIYPNAEINRADLLVKELEVYILKMKRYWNIFREMELKEMEG